MKESPEALELESRPSCNNDAILHDLSNSSIFKREKVSYKESTLLGTCGVASILMPKLTLKLQLFMAIRYGPFVLCRECYPEQMKSQFELVVKIC